MARALERKKTARNKQRKIARSAKQVPSKTKKGSLRSGKKTTAHLKKIKPKDVIKSRKKTIKKTKPPARRKKTVRRSDTKKLSSMTPIAVAPPRLLRETKATSAALSILEKSIRLIHQRNFKKARGELKMLLETHPGETEILARARSYIQICERESSRKMTPVTNDQLYSLGVLEHNKANYDLAISYFRQSLETHPDADYIYYSLAASMAMKGDVSDAIKNLRKAIDLNEDSRIHARNDPDFSSLQSEKEFADLIGISPLPASESL